MVVSVNGLCSALSLSLLLFEFLSKNRAFKLRGEQGKWHEKSKITQSKHKKNCLKRGKMRVTKS